MYIFAQNLRTAEEQSLKFLINEMNKTDQVSHNLWSVFCFILIHIQLLACSCESTKFPIAYLTSWHNSIFGYKLRTMRLKILKKLRTASLNSEFTGSFLQKKMLSLKYSNFSNFFLLFSVCRSDNFWERWREYTPNNLKSSNGKDLHWYDNFSTCLGKKGVLEKTTLSRPYLMSPKVEKGFVDW